MRPCLPILNLPHLVAERRRGVAWAVLARQVKPRQVDWRTARRAITAEIAARAARYAARRGK